jgi:hypothetical protein
MTLFLHIGIGKTGTTSIQTFLEMNAPALANLGVVMPSSLGKRNHRRLAMYALNDEVIDNSRRAKRLATPEAVRLFREHALKDFRAESAKLRAGHAVVMSSEQMTRLRRPGEISRLKDFVSLAGHDEIRVIVYLRRQDLYYVSEYSQEIKGGKDIPFRPDGKVVNRDIYFYDRLLGYWSEVFGRSAIVVRPFEQSALRNGDAINDFMSIIGIDDLCGFQRPPPRNPSLDAYAIEFLRRLNPSVPRWGDGGEDMSRLRLVRAIEAISDGPKLRMSRDNAERFLSLFAESNALVARDYLGRKELFEEEIAHAEGMEPALPVEAARRIANAVFSNVILDGADSAALVKVIARAWNDLKQRDDADERTPTLAVAPSKSAQAANVT